MKLKKSDLHARVKGPLPVTFCGEKLSAHAGLALFESFLVGTGWMRRIRAVFAGRGFDTDYGSYRMTLAVLGLLLVGGRRLAHLRELAIDPVFLHFTRLQRLPSERTLSRWLKEQTSFYRERLAGLVREVAYATWRRIELRRVTLDLDGTVIRTGESAQGAARGFNPHHPKDPSYYPLTAHLAQTGQILDVVNRPGNVNDSQGAVERLRFLIADVRTRLGAVPIEVRLDGAFCQEAVLELLTASGVSFAMRMPMWRWLPVRQRINDRRRWVRVNDRVEAFSLQQRIEPWNRTERLVVFRKRIAGRPAKDFQLDLLQPDDGFYEYSMVVTNKTESEATIWAFMAGRGGHEKTLAELKQHLAFGSVVTDDWDANSTWQLLSALAHNLARHFQVETGLATRRRNSRKRTARRRFLSVQTLRFLVLNVPGRLARPQGRTQLRLAAAPKTRRRLERAQRTLAA